MRSAGDGGHRETVELRWLDFGPAALYHVVLKPGDPDNRRAVTVHRTRPASLQGAGRTRRSGQLRNHLKGA